MFIGHFAFSYILIFLAPSVPPLVPLAGVSFPDILWPLLVLAGIEKVSIDPENPLQKAIVFSRYPYSHSLLVGTLIACLPGVVIGLVLGPLPGVIFIIASASHWVLDSVVHLKDLPVIGFGKDRNVGLGLWKMGRITFVLELAFYVAVTLLVVPSPFTAPLLVIGFLFHLVNANSFLGFSKKNPFGTPNLYAMVALSGFIAFIVLANSVFTGVL